jgi:tetratricopeptide (TPR) repeat protein
MRGRALLILVTALVVGTPALSQMSGSGVPPNSGQDPNYDDMRADMDAKKNTETANEFVTGAGLVKQQQFAAAIPHLEAAFAKNPRNVTLLIYLGFSHRMVGGASAGVAQAAEFKKALDYYQQGLAIDADNKLLHEYLGKLDLLMREYGSAADELKTLQTLCPSDCAERTALAQAIQANPPPPSPVTTAPPGQIH